MKKSPFKKAGLMTTLTNVGLGGAANVAIDYVVANVDALKTLDPMYINGGKILAGALLGSSSKNHYVHAAADGIAVVGAANLIASLIESDSAPSPSSGLSRGTVGKVVMGDPYFKRRSSADGFKVAGAFVGK